LLVKPYKNMHYPIFVAALVSLLVPQILTAQNSSEEIEIYEEWRLQKEKDGIQIYTRWVPVEEDRKARQMHAIMQVDASLEAVVMAFSDQEQVPKWLSRAQEYFHFIPQGKTDWYAYTRFNIPWPMQDQDLITRNQLTQDSDSRQVHVTIEGVKDYIPEKKDAMRIPHFEGTWDFTPNADGSIKVDYYLFVKSKPVLPRWMIDPIVEYGMWRTFSDFRETAEGIDEGPITLPISLN
jgi:hypothetical protein